MTPSRARGRKVRKMGGLLRDGDLHVIEKTREAAVAECAWRRPGSKHIWSYCPVTVAYTLPTKPKPRKAK